MVVHPQVSEDKATAVATAYLTDLQIDDRGWGNELSFSHTVNALVHLELPQARRQFERTFKRMIANRNGKGTRSRSEPEWKMFLAIHALKNKGLP
jgi:hypothetical protein